VVSNDRLAAAMAAQSLTRRGLAERLSVDAKTVERWVAGRVPHPRHRTTLALVLAQPESYLWPGETTNGRGVDVAGLIGVFPHRCEVPQPLWRSLLRQAQEQIDVLAYAALFLAEDNPQLVSTLAAKADHAAVRLLLGDPASTKVAERGKEEELFDGMASRIRTTLLHLRPLADIPGIAVHLHETTLYNSIFRFDDEMLVNNHVYGGPAYRSPVMHLRRTPGCGLFDTYASSFEAVWRTSTPISREVWSQP
jgi:hypothetical protein